MPGMPDAGLARMHSPTQTLLGFDYGLRRIGVAVGQRVTGTARALITLSATDGVPDWNQIANLIATWQPDALIVGLPLQLDGTHSSITVAAERFARRLHGRFGLPVHLHDERLSSHAASELRDSAAVKLARNTNDSIDHLAAQVILQDWLDSQGD